MFAAYLGEVMIFLPSFGGPSRLCLPFSADNEQLLCRKQGSRGFPLEQITHAALCDTGTRRWCPAAPSQPSPALLNIWGVLRTRALKIPAPCQKWQPPPGPSWHLHWVKSLNQKYSSSAIPPAWGKGGKGRKVAFISVCQWWNERGSAGIFCRTFWMHGSH